MAVGLLTLYAPPLIDGNPAICKVFPAQSIQTLILGVVCVIALPALSSVKDRHPWNMVAVTAWTLLWGVFLAAAHVPGGLLKSNVLFVMFGACTLGVILLTIFSTCCTFRDAETGEKSLMSFGSAGTLAWILTVIAAFVFYANTTSHYETVAHFIAGEGPVPRWPRLSLISPCGVREGSRPKLDPPPPAARAPHPLSSSCLPLPAY
jgi:hypothetical protein